MATSVAITTALALVAAVLAAAGATASPLGGPLTATAAADKITVDPTTNMFVDATGRVRIFHGLNFDQKSPPFYPHEADEVLARYADEGGFNMVRLAIEWAAIEPSKGVYNDTYLHEVRGFANQLAAHGFYYYLDMHQDTWGYALCGNGAPTWATELSTFAWTSFPAPATGAKTCELDGEGHPMCDKCPPMPGGWWGAKYFSVADCAAFGALYSNKDGLRDAWVAMWAHTASVLKDLPMLVGYELMNEPWMGDIYSDPKVLLETGYADRQYLAPMYAAAAAAIRQVDPSHHWIMFEPSTRDTQLFPFGSGFPEVPGGAAFKDRSVFSWHHYCPLSMAPNGTVEQAVCDNFFADRSFDLHVSDGRKLGGGLFLSEFGATGGSPVGLHELNYILALADQYLQSWTFWDASILAGNSTSSQAVFATLGRPYPRAVAGTDLSFKVAAGGNGLLVSFAVDTGISAPTELFVGVDKEVGDVTMQPAGAFSVTRSSHLLQLRPTAGLTTGTKVTVNVTLK